MIVLTVADMSKQLTINTTYKKILNPQIVVTT